MKLIFRSAFAFTRPILFLSILFIFSPAHAVDIQNFKSGLVCSDGKRLSSICHSTDEIYITGQSICTWESKAYPCTWYGFEFEYKNNAAPTKIDCVSKDNQLTDKGNPEEVVSADSNEYTYTIELKENNGRYFNPQYSLLSNRNIRLLTQTTCKVDDVVVFSFRFNQYFPIKS